MRLKLVRFLNKGETKTTPKICGGIVGKLFEIREKEDYFLNIYTLERPLTHEGIENVRNKTCIPAGTYQVVLEYSEKFKRELFEIKGVLNRNEAKFHSGNHINHSNGCPIVGKLFLENIKNPNDNKLYELWLGRSKEAEEEMKKKLPKEFTITIENAFN